VKVLGGGIGIAEVEADAHALLTVLPDCDGPAFGISADEVPDQEIPRSGFLLKLVHDDAEEQ
jgi:hypothetical protein